MPYAQNRFDPSDFCARADPSSSLRGAQIARVVSVARDTLLVTAKSGPAEPWQVGCALPEGLTLKSGDQVVVLASAEGPVAIARLRNADTPTIHTLNDGAQVKVDPTCIVVERADGSPVFKYEIEGSRGKVTLAAESLQLAATAGDLSLRAAGTIRLDSRALSARAHMPGESTTFELDPRRARLRANELELSVGELKLEAHRAQLSGDELHGNYKRAVLTLDRLETVVDTAVSRAREVYQNVQGLLQQQAGSLRTLVSGSAQLKAREVSHRADEGYKVRAAKIHLG